MLPRENGYMAEYRIALPLLPVSLARCEPHAYALPSGGTGGSPSLLPETGYRTMANVQLDNIRKVYDNGQIAVHGASFEVADGELMVLVGPSGCGKSTLLRMIAGLEEISGGELRIGERVVNDVAPKDRDIAMVFQSYALYPHMTVAENLAFGLKLRGESKEVIARRVAAAADTLGLTPMLDKLPRAMSGGQRQRVALGRALVREPAVFLLDEPLSNLDAKLRHSVRTEIAQLHRKLGTTMIYVTHDQVEAMTLGQRIVVLKDGLIQQIDTPMALYDRPANLFVAGFLGSPAMNVLQGQLVEDDGLQLQLADGSRVTLHGAQVAPQWLGRPIAIGVRPEHLQPSADGQGGFETTVEMIEPVGNEIFVNLSHGSQPLVMRVAPRTLPGLGERLRVAVRGEALHFFDAESGERLEARDSGLGTRDSEPR
ncbi:carbohydrate uptake ABC transporter ATP-binding protein [Xanthomonas translucens pv. translucens DSM 18974]|uniref:Carbohydrate uptake ABC transporter ATP-binding protein n=3 Tax=Xanthomonas campestris pv. translucens TaxID=343 RepID=A0A1C3TN86_XANCT|nr:sn-glycerol 3-phosphate transport system ATP-binding protein [Xanthomonas translucens pv. translucens DSM 18974]SCB04691.1 carbohydrate uptake ABC transporter ATP-binding protein [Xanthomonas translucens pv. translucens DSM 18974]